VNVRFDFYVRSLRRCKGMHGESRFDLEVEKRDAGWRIAGIGEKVHYREMAFNPC
jgi:hypothetical protein